MVADTKIDTMSLMVTDQSSYLLNLSVQFSFWAMLHSGNGDHATLHWSNNSQVFAQPTLPLSLGMPVSILSLPCLGVTRRGCTSYSMLVGPAPPDVLMTSKSLPATSLLMTYLRPLISTCNTSSTEQLNFFRSDPTFCHRLLSFQLASYQWHIYCMQEMGFFSNPNFLPRTPLLLVHLDCNTFRPL